MSDAFQSMFSGSEIAEQFSMVLQKASCRMELGLLKMVFVAVCQKQKVCLL